MDEDSQNRIWNNEQTNKKIGQRLIGSDKQSEINVKFQTIQK